MAEKIKAWHFTDRLKLRDGNTLEAGCVYSVKGPLVMCEWGLHQSERALDALRYAPDSHVSRVLAWGDVERQDDKFVARHREVLWHADATDTLFACARKFALDVVHLWKAPDVVKRFLETGDESLRAAARDASWAAAKAATRAATWDVVREATWAAARATARAAAEDAAWDSTRAAARDASWAAAKAATRAATRDATGAVARAVGWDVAWDVARAAQNDYLEAELRKLAPKGMENE